jgi:serine/threonine-protein kinase
MNTATGFQLDSKYIIQAELGRGGMGIVYRGFDTILQRPVAIKVLAPPLTQDAEAVEHFRQEAVAAANLQHPNIVTIHAVGEVNGYYYIVMELLEGAPLDKWLVGRGPLPLAQAQHILRQLAGALDYAHQRQLVHRDVKPANVMLAANGHATLMDFGLVRAAAGGDGHSTGGGTPTYMAPEQILGAAVDCRADIYALGVILYEMVTGQALFARDAPLAVAYAHLTDAPRPPRQLRPDLPAPAEAVMLKALAKKPEDRFARAGELAAAFALACSNQWPAGFKQSPTPPPKKQLTPAPRPMRAGLPLPWLALLIVLLVAVMGGLAWALMRPSDAGVLQPPTVIAGGSSAAPNTLTAVTNDIKTAPPLVASPTSPATAPLAATNTLAPTPTHTPTARATPTPAPATATSTTTSPPAAPLLLEPAEGLQVTGDTTFVWSWIGQLADNQAFEVHLWQDGTADHLTAAEAAAQRAGGDRWQQAIDVSQTAAVRAGGPGAYWWTVAVVHIKPYQPVGDEAPPRRLNVK